MFSLNRLSPFLILVVLVISACQTINGTDIKDTSKGLRPNAPTYAAHGPFAVGYRQLIVGKDSNHPLELSLWYPARNPTGAKEGITYIIKNKRSTWSPKHQPIIYGHALLNTEIDSSHGPYPLIVFSHGFSACASLYNVLLEHYASYGFIVLAPDHTEQFDISWSDLWKASIDRPSDIRQTLDYAESLTAPDGTMAGIIDMEHVAVVGHSYGGYTALAMAGAQYDLNAYNARCTEIHDDDPLAFLCSPLVPNEQDMATRAGYTSIPQGLWASFGDPRVKAIIPMAGDSYLFDKLGLTSVHP
jgi:predicted dienelactone hydrolase